MQQIAQDAHDSGTVAIRNTDNLRQALADEQSHRMRIHLLEERRRLVDVVDGYGGVSTAVREVGLSGRVWQRVVYLVEEIRSSTRAIVWHVRRVIGVVLVHGASLVKIT